MFAVPAKKPLTFVDWLSSFFYTPLVKVLIFDGIILDQDIFDPTGIADVRNEVMEIVRSAHSIQSEDSGNVLQMTTAQGFPDQEQHLMPSIADVHNEVMEIVRSAHSIQSEDSGNVLQMTTAKGFADQEQHLMPSIADVHNEVMEIVRSAHSIQSEDSGNVLQMTTAQGFPDQEQQLMPSIADVRNEVMEIVRSAHSIQSEDSGNVLQMTTAQGFADQEQHLMPSIADVHNEVMEIVRSAHSIQSEDSGNVLQMTTAQAFADQEQHLMPSIADVHNEVMEIVRSAHSIQSEDSGNVLQMTTAQGFPDQEQQLMPSIADVRNEVMEIVRSAHSFQSEDSGNVLQMTTAQGFADQDQVLTPSEEQGHSLLPLRDEPQEVKPKLQNLKLTNQDYPGSLMHPQLRSDIKKVKEEFKDGIVTIRVDEDVDMVFVDLNFKTVVFQCASVIDGLTPYIVRLGFCHSKYIYGNEPSVKFLTNPNEEIHFTHLFLMEKMLKTFLLSRWQRVNALDHPEISLRHTNRKRNLFSRLLDGLSRFLNGVKRATFYCKGKNGKEIPIQTLVNNSKLYEAEDFASPKQKGFPSNMKECSAEEKEKLRRSVQ
uniref:uncharacterized protein n=1 Tax=Myxine glutinosa TaxID=7769 RepID=UPI00358ED047